MSDLTDPMAALARSPDLIRAASAVLRTRGRAHIQGVMSQDRARTLHAALVSTDWRVIFRDDQGPKEYPLRDVNTLQPREQQRMLQFAYATAREGFQFLYDTYRISDEVRAGNLTAGPLADFYHALNTPFALELLRKITGEPRIRYVDAQATRYRPGHFLSRHDDDVDSKVRLFAYVLNLTPSWRADWGGLLMFIGPDGHVSEAFTPAWNALNILRVPQPHAVSMVTPFAGGDRYSITGWMRSEAPAL